MVDQESVMIDGSKIAIATMTLARTGAEEKLLRRSLTRLVSLGMPVVAVDGGSRPEFVLFVKGLGIQIEKAAKRGLVPQVDASITAAAHLRRRFILYTEPDKEQFFSGPILEFLRAIKPSKKIGVTLAARDAKGFRTFPPAQSACEALINSVAGDVFGVEGDYCYGPLLFPSSLTKEVKGLTMELGWGWRFHLMRRAHELGLRISHVPLKVECPATQRRENAKERIYRYRQLRQNLQGTIG